MFLNQTNRNTIMKSLFAALLIALSFNVVAAPEVNPDAVAKIIENSKLVSCLENYCYDLDNNEELIHDTAFPDGVTVIFPVGLVSAEELESSRSEVLHFWKQHHINLMASRGLYLD